MTTTNREAQSGGASAPEKRYRPFRQNLPLSISCDCTKKCECVSPVPMACGCVNHNGGEITYCPTHDAAPEMYYFVKLAAGIACPGRTECGKRFPCDGCRARALLARIEGR